MAFSVAAGEREFRFIPVESVKAPPKPNIVWYLGNVLMRIEVDQAGDTVRCSERRNSELNLKHLHISYRDTERQFNSQTVSFVENT